MKHTLRHKGFSLVELSIALVIVGLIAGGVFGGRALLHASELKSIVSQSNEYKAAVASFYQRYNAFPGDMANATAFWSAENATHSTCIALTTASTTSATCNGDGNGKIAPTTTTLESGSTDYESFRAWQHLHNAGLSDEDVTGVQGSGGTRHAVIAENIPPAQYSNAVGWSFANLAYTTANTAPCADYTAGSYTLSWCTVGSVSVFTGREYGNVLLLGAQTTDDFSIDDFLNPTDAYSIDEKYDDGMPQTGAIAAAGTMSGTPGTRCFAANATTGNAEYDITSATSGGSSAKYCSLIFTIQ